MRIPELPTSFTTADAFKAGLTEGRLTRLVASGRVLRIRRGLYAVAPAAPVAASARRAEHLVRAAATLAAYDDRVAASHLTAAAAWGLPLPLRGVDLVHAVRLEGARRTRRSPGLLVHHADSSEPAPVPVGELLATPLARTVADCLVTFPPRVSLPIADAALHGGRTTPTAVSRELEAMRHWGGKVRRARVAAPLVDGRRESWLESYAAAVFDEWGIDPPVPQLIVLDRGRRFVARADAGWEADATVVELDGKEKYRLDTDDPRPAWEAEKDRYDAVGNLGVERVRFGLPQLLHDEHLVTRRIAERRRIGSRERFTGSFQTLPPLTLPWPPDRPDTGTPAFQGL